MTNMKPLVAYRNEDNMEARVFANNDGVRFNVALHDIDSGETDQTFRIFSDFDQACAYAKMLI